MKRRNERNEHRTATGEPLKCSAILRFDSWQRASTLVINMRSPKHANSELP
jgi:hypothetical protein